MSFNKKDLEIVYSLRWKNGPKRVDKQMSIVAVYDIPSTTLNFEVFKSYLLKNSGISEDDVRVSYIMDNGKEYPIQSQTDFLVALYAFRRKARAGEEINLLLERISDQPCHKNLRHSNDVETQFDNEQHSIASTSCSADIPPDWFMAGLAQLKKEIKEEVTANVSTIVASAMAEIKARYPIYSSHSYRSIRRKPDKHVRKVCHGTDDVEKKSHVSSARALLKSLKLEDKLDKIERKASKYRERRLALQHGQKSTDQAKSSDSETGGNSASGSRSRDKEEKRKQEEKLVRKTEEKPNQKSEEDEFKMDAIPVNMQTSIPHMLGGEIYLHQWDVQNNGQAQWTSMTHLIYTWGSRKLVPLEKIIPVPFLKPGETGTVSVRLQIPCETGKYECYWQFMHKGRRFGHWLGVQVIVDPFDLKGHSSVLHTSALDSDCSYQLLSESEGCEKLDRSSEIKSRENHKSAEALASLYKSLSDDKEKKCEQLLQAMTEEVRNVAKDLVDEVSHHMSELSLEQLSLTDLAEGDKLRRTSNDDSDCSWSSEPTHFWAKTNEKRNGEFVMVPIPQCFVLDTPDSSENNCVKKDDKKKSAETETVPKKDEEALVANTSGVHSSTPRTRKDSNFDDNNNTEGSSPSSGSIKLRDEELDNIVVITVPKDEQVKEGFIYVHVDGQKVLIPKNILKSEVVNAAQELEKSPSATNSVGVIIDSNESTLKSSTPPETLPPQNVAQEPVKKDDDLSGNTMDSVPTKTLEEPIVMPQPAQENVAVDLSTTSRDNAEYTAEDAGDRSNYFEANNYMSHCSAAGSCFSEVNSQAERQNRLFIFPQDVPGYEVIYPVLDTNNPNYPTLTTHTFVPPPHPGPIPATWVENSQAFQTLHHQVPNPFTEHVPNFQQTPPEMRRTTPAPADPKVERPRQPYSGVPCVDNHPLAFQEETPPSTTTASAPQEAPGNTNTTHTPPPQVHILPETFVSGAVNVATSAMSTARSVINNIIKPQPQGRWVNGHWVSNNPDTPREANLQALAEMGFWNRDLNATLLARFNDDLNRVVAELVQ